MSPSSSLFVPARLILRTALLPALLGLLVQPHAARAGEFWTIDPDAVLVLGQSDFVSNTSGDGAAGMNSPNDVAVDPVSGKIFVADFSHHRVLRFASFGNLADGADAEAVLGQPDFATTTAGTDASTMTNPTRVAVDSAGRLWVCDGGNNRVLRFDGASTLASGSPADAVLGQPDFTTETSGQSASEMNAPNGLAIDGDGNLFVGDTGNSRVLVFLSAAGLDDGDPANSVLGQDDFSSFGGRSGIDGTNAPRGVAVDADGNLFVADRGNSRILRFDKAAKLPNGSNANGVLGQPDFATTTPGTGADGTPSPSDLAVDGEGRLWVLHSGNVVKGFSNATGLPNGADADLLIAQPDFNSGATGTTASRLGFARGIATDATGRVYIADSSAHRVLVFEKDRHFPDLTIGEKASSQRGRNRYNRSGAGQKKSVRIEDKEAKLIAFLENDGNLSDSYLLRAKSTNAKWRIRVFRMTGGRKNITGQAKRGVYDTGEILPGARIKIDHRVKPKRKIRGKRRTLNAWIRATSTTDGEIDKVVSRVKNRP